MLDVDAWLAQSKVDARMIMQVHDELILEVKSEQAETIAQDLAQRMMNAAKLDVPLLVEAGIGDNWDQAH